MSVRGHFKSGLIRQITREGGVLRLEVRPAWEPRVLTQFDFSRISKREESCRHVASLGQKILEALFPGLVSPNGNLMEPLYSGKISEYSER